VKAGLESQSLLQDGDQDVNSHGNPDLSFDGILLAPVRNDSKNAGKTTARCAGFVGGAHC
jgi:hypothetical protein